MPTFLPSHLLTFYLFTFLFFKISALIRASLLFPLSPFLFPIFELNVLVLGAWNFYFWTRGLLFVGILNRPGLTNHHDFDLPWKG